MEELIPLEIPVTVQTVRLIKSYAALSGHDLEEISKTLGENISVLLEARLKDMIAREVGATIPGNQTTHAKTYIKQSIPNEELLADGLGDAQESEDIPPSDELPIPRGGLRMEDIDRDMEIDDPTKEAKAEPLDLVMPTDDSTDILADAVGYTDSWSSKRKKRFGQGRGKVKALSDSVLAEGAGA